MSMAWSYWICAKKLQSKPHRIAGSGPINSTMASIRYFSMVARIWAVAAFEGLGRGGRSGLALGRHLDCTGRD